MKKNDLIFRYRGRDTGNGHPSTIHPKRTNPKERQFSGVSDMWSFHDRNLSSKSDFPRVLGGPTETYVLVQEYLLLMITVIVLWINVTCE